MRTSALAVASALVLFVVAPASADTLTLRDGSVMQGSYAGGTPNTIQFKTSAGNLMVDVKNVATLAFGGGAAAAAPAAAAAAPAAAVAKGPIPAGTTILVRNVDTVTSNSKAGSVFAVVVDSDVVVNGVPVIKAGTKGYGKVEASDQAGRVAGKSMLAITLSEIEIGGQRVKVDTTSLASQGEGSMKKTARGALVGTAIGAAAGGGDGAAKGAAVGASATLLKKGQTIGVAPKTLLEFQFEQAVQIPAS